MPAEREKMIATLKEKVIPVLKVRGFKGSFPHFRRITEAGVHLLTFQFDKWGGGFVVEIASCPAAGVTMPWGKHIPPEKVTAQNVNSRFRLGASDKGSDHWFRYDRANLSFGDPYQQAASEVLSYLEAQAESYWSAST
jgi:hypothetical protein